MSTPSPTSVPRVAYSVAEVAAMGLLKKSRIYELIDEGMLPAKLVGNKRVILVEELERFKAHLADAPTGRYKPKRRRP